MFNLESAIALALQAHKGQKDKAGEPYILHPLAVMMTFQPYQLHERMTAVLHDVLEDSSLTAEDLIYAGAPNEVVRACVLMCHKDGTMYEDYVKNLLHDDLARVVKRADITHNMTQERMLRLDPEKRERLLKKYTLALKLINQHEHTAV